MITSGQMIRNFQFAKCNVHARHMTTSSESITKQTVSVRHMSDAWGKNNVDASTRELLIDTNIISL